MQLYLTNTLTKRKEEFIPIDNNNIRMYACGPTVYDRPHLGNARASVTYDLLYRVLKEIYPKVTYVRNVTDVDDKIINKANKRSIPIEALTEEILKYYHADMRTLGCGEPTIEPKATEHISETIELIQKLLELGYAYEAKGHVIFDVLKDKNYGKLSKRNYKDMVAGSRVEVAPYKRNPHDFILWKPVKQAEDGFASPWGQGRPGWHIECSAMAKKYLGDHFDIHGGGVDLTFPHHENEIAQSECANRSTLANYWVHNGFLTINNEKMSKSLGNFSTVQDLLNKGIDGNVLRYLLLHTHYRKPLDFNTKAISDAKKSVQKLSRFLHLGIEPIKDDKFLEALLDDLNTPFALARLHELASLCKRGDTHAMARLRYCCSLIGLKPILNEQQTAIDDPETVIDEAILQLASDRAIARQNKDWERADVIRKKLQNSGYQIVDQPDGSYKVIASH